MLALLSSTDRPPAYAAAAAAAAMRQRRVRRKRVVIIASDARTNVLYTASRYRWILLRTVRDSTSRKKRLAIRSACSIDRFCLAGLTSTAQAHFYPCRRFALPTVFAFACMGNGHHRPIDLG